MFGIFKRKAKAAEQQAAPKVAAEEASAAPSLQPEATKSAPKRTPKSASPSPSANAELAFDEPLTSVASCKHEIKFVGWTSDRNAQMHRCTHCKGQFTSWPGGTFWEEQRKI